MRTVEEDTIELRIVIFLGENSCATGRDIAISLNLDPTAAAMALVDLERMGIVENCPNTKQYKLNADEGDFEDNENHVRVKINPLRQSSDLSSYWDQTREKQRSILGYIYIIGLVAIVVAIAAYLAQNNPW